MMIMMKISFFFSALALVSSPAATHAKPSSFSVSSSKKSQKSSLGPKDGQPSPQEVLESTECEPFRMDIEKRINELFKYDDDTISNAMCNPIQRETLVAATGEMEKKVKNKQNTDPCLHAYEMLLLENQYELMEELVSEETCNDEVQKEIAMLRGFNDERRGALRGRNLLNGNDFLLAGSVILFGGAIIAFVIIAISASDIRLKEDIQQVGVSPSGIPTYTFKYRSDIYDLVNNDPMLDVVDTTSTYYGAMAQDLLSLAPNAVIHMDNGYYAVDYSKIDVDFHKIE